MSKLWLWLLPLLVLVIGSPQATATAQTTSSADCPALVTDALARLDATCAGLGRNSICYGNTRVAVTFNRPMGDEVFDTPSDQSELKDVELVQTAPLDEALKQWGLAVLNVQANVPGTLPGQGVIFVLMGDASLSNLVDPANLPDPDRAMEVTSSQRVNVRSAPSLRANVLGALEPGQPVPADIQSQDGEWVRIVFNQLPAWVSRGVVTAAGDLSTLPAPAPTGLSPMQAFQFTGGIGVPTCAEAQGALLIQGPDKLVVNLEANGARISLASTVLLRQGNNRLNVTALSGAAKVNEVLVPAGFTTSAALDEASQIVDEFTEPEPLDAEDFAALDEYELLAEDVLHYEIDLDDAELNAEELDLDELSDEDFDFGTDDDFDFDDAGDDDSDDAGDDGSDDTGDDGSDDAGDDGSDDTGDDGSDDAGDDGSDDTGDDGSDDAGDDGSDDAGDDGSDDTGDDGSDDTGDDGGGDE